MNTKLLKTGIALIVCFPVWIFFPCNVGEAHFDGTNHIHPDTITATLCPGECLHEVKHVDLEGTPEKLDLIFAIDLTASMTPILDAVKANAVNIMNDLRGIIPDSWFGNISFMDYPNFPATYNFCGYNASYGDPAAGDYPYRLDNPLISNTVLVSNTINAYVLGDGLDLPESYTRVFYESYTDPTVGWRPGSKRILLTFGDNFPHDCDIFSCIAVHGFSYGADPGRNAIVGDFDDLELIPVINMLTANNITLLVVYRNDPIGLWSCLAGLNGGLAFDFDSVPITEIRDSIVDLVEATIGTIANLTLITTPGYESWLTSLVPLRYTGITLDHPQRFTFNIDICVPLGTPPGVYTFEVMADGDGAVYARQSVSITVCAYTPTMTPTPTFTSTPTNTPTYTPTSTPTRTPTPTPTMTPTPTPPPTIPCCWLPADNAGEPLNTAYRDWHPTIASDDTTLYFASNRPGGFGFSDILVTVRTGPDVTDWAVPVNLGPNINTFYFESAPTLTGNMQTLYFMGYNPAVENYDIFCSTFSPVLSGWLPRQLVKNPVSSPVYDDRHPYIFKDGSKILFDSDRPGGAGNFDIWEATHVRGSWVDVKPLPVPVNSSAYEAAPCVWEGPGKMELYYETERNGTSQLYVSEWDPFTESWITPKRMCLDFISSLHPSINRGGSELFYHSSGGYGNYDIFVAICEPTPTPTGTWFTPTATYTEALPYPVPVSSFAWIFLIGVSICIVIAGASLRVLR